jgi:chemotaxis protein histidine kinase CheA
VDDPVVEALVAGFVAEARAICSQVTGNVLALEHADELTDAERTRHYEQLARGLHTLKGNADTFGFPELAELAHRMEDVVRAFQPGRTLPATITDLLLRAADVLVARLAVRDDPRAAPPLDDLVAALVAAATGRAPEIAPPSAPMASIDVDIADWRVGAHHVDALSREVERLRELRLRLDEQRRELARSAQILARTRTPELASVRDSLELLARGLDTDRHEAGDIIEALEQELQTIATLPVRWIVDPLQRAVRDLGRSLGKEVRLACVGAEISLERRLLDTLKGPLVHLVRNAVDHGIEMPEARIAAGKHREGAITIRVERAGNLVVVEVEDDGTGIDPARVREVAIARGLATVEGAEALAEPELHALLFRSGFSTRGDVTEVSGRGVGLDVVRGAVASLSGQIDVHTTRGSGTRFTITVPATLGSTPILIVRVDEQQFGVPLMAIETIRTAREDIQAGHAPRLEHAGQLLPLVDLGATLGLRTVPASEPDRPILIVHAHGKRIALAVDELVGDRDLVVRPLPPELLDLPAYQGASTQARGDVLLVLQPEFLVEGRTAAMPAPGTVRRALVVDDSLTARALHRTILESGGYHVHAVASARQAIANLRHAHYDVVIADVMMAEVDGHQLVAMLRARRDTHDLPIILVSSHDTQLERERGLAAGADAFLSKRDCISGRLLAEVASAIARRPR